jgi:hypothetical protein
MALSEAYRQDTGHGLIDLFAALKVGVYWSLDHEVTCVELDHFTNQLHSVTSASINPRAAFQDLVLAPGAADLDALQPHALRHQPTRLVKHPFIVSGNMVVLVRDLLFLSLQRHWAQLMAGEWPLSPRVRRQDLPEFHAALLARRQARGIHSFERLVGDRLDAAFLPNESLGNGARFGAARTSREVDFVAVDLPRRIMWVLEAKDMFDDGTLLSARADIDEFYKPRGFVSKLQRSVDEVAVDPTAVAHHVLSRTRARWRSRGSEHQALTDAVAIGTGAWTVRGAFVVRDHSAIEHVTDGPFPVATASSLVDLLLDAPQ